MFYSEFTRSRSLETIFTYLDFRGCHQRAFDVSTLRRTGSGRALRVCMYKDIENVPSNLAHLEQLNCRRITNCILITSVCVFSKPTILGLFHHSTRLVKHANKRLGTYRASWGMRMFRCLGLRLNNTPNHNWEKQSAVQNAHDEKIQNAYIAKHHTTITVHFVV